MSPRSWPLLLGLGACILENPAFKDDGTGTGTGAGTGTETPASTTTDDPTTSSAGDGTTTSSPTAASTTDASTTDDTTTGPACIPDPQGPACQTRSVSGHNYLLCEDPVSWATARDACAKRCATLVIFSDSTATDNPESLALAADLRMLMSDQDKMEEQKILDGDYPQQDSPRASWWIGGNRRGDNQWYWLDDAPMPGHAMGGWNPDDPDTNPDSDQQCAVVAVFGADEDDGKWFDRICTAAYRYVCELP